MRRAHTYLATLVALALALATPARPQDATSEADRGFLQRLIEDSLSGAGREVRLAGFAGALSSRATIDELTVADAEGVWLTIREAAIKWNRGALLRGRIEIAELSAARIVVARAPVAAPDPGLPDPAAQPFRLPELPVSVRIDRIAADRVSLGAPLLGEEVAVSLAGALRLADGAGEAVLSVERIDGREGTLTLDGRFDNATSALFLSLDLTEPQDGIAARLFGLPGRPALQLSVAGEGPLSDFSADLTLASDGEPRLAGTLALIEDAAVSPDDGTPPRPPGRRFRFDVAGDIAPLFLPEYRDFFGSEVRLAAEGTRTAEGAIELAQLRLRTATVALDGSARIAPDGLPQAFRLTGRIAAPGGGPVPLPLTGEPVGIDAADVDIAFDAARGEAWSGRARIAGFRRGGDRIARLALDAGGEIVRAARRGVTARIDAAAEGVAPADPALAAALGSRVGLDAELDWQEGAPLAFRRLAIVTDTARLTAQGTLGPVAEGLPLALRGSADLADLVVFSGLAGQPLAGRVVLGLNGTVTLLDRRFDLRLGGTGRDLAAGIGPLDRLLAGESRFRADARRDQTGITLRDLAIETAEARIAARGLVRSGQTRLEAEARVAETGRVVPELSGPATLAGQIAEEAPGRYTVTAGATGPGGGRAEFAGTILETARGTLAAEGRLDAGVADASAYARLAGTPLRGQAQLTFTGSAAPAEDRFDGTLELTGRSLGIGQPTADRLLGGTLRLTAAAAREGEVTTVRRIDLSTGELTASLAGTLGRVEGRLTGRARLRNVGIFAPDFPGPLSAEGTLGRDAAGRWQVDVRAEGPGGTRATVTGSTAPDAASVDLRAVGQAPLGLANAAIAPRAVRGTADFDLALSGPPRFEGLSGRITTRGARLVAPTFGGAVDGIGGTVALGGGRATLDLSGAVEGGGRIGVTGGLGLAAPFDAALRIALSGARLSAPDLYRTSVDGVVSLTGPLGGGALAGGVINLGETEVRIAATGQGAGGEVEGLRHVSEPPAVRLTRRRAGFDAGNGPAGRGDDAARPLRLDLLVNAPNQIFVRGRGLDAELGGSIRLAGTTAEVLPQGQFDLLRGRLDILGRRLTMTEGVARLQGSFDPYLRLVATSEAEGITARVVLEGLASDPEIRFESAPELPEDEVLARLFFGRDLTQLSPLQAAQLASAVAELSGRGGGGVVNRLRDRFGLDDLDVTTGEDGSAALRAGRYLTENAYTEVTVGSDGKSDISINLDLTPSLTVRGRVGSEGDSGLGVFFQKDY